MPPPNLPADAPIPNVLDPLLVNFFPMLRPEADEMAFHNRERFLGFRIFQKPLLAQARLDPHIAAIPEADVVFIRLCFRVPSPRLRQFAPLLPPFVTLAP